MRVSDEEYFRSCVAKERHLAHLLGHHQIEECYEPGKTTPTEVKAGATSVLMSDHLNRDRAVMVAIVKEVILRLEHHKAAKAA